MIKLYEAMTWVPAHDGTTMQPIHWWCERRTSPLVDYAEAIAGYERLQGDERFYPRDCIDEYLTAAEVAELRGFVAKHYDWQVIAREVELPIGANRAGLGALSVGGATDFLILTATPGYDLSIRIWGYFDRHDAEPLDRARLVGTSSERCRAINSPAATRN